MTAPAPAEKPFVRLYRYFKTEYALAAIERRELRVSRIAELNDPFEFSLVLIGADGNPLPEEVSRHLLVEERDDVVGLICMSGAGTLKQPLMWSHYTGAHRGIALGFDYLTDESLVDISYPAKRPKIKAAEFVSLTDTGKNLAIKAALTAKAGPWGYEEEKRVLVDLPKCRIQGGHYFTPIPDDFLKHVVLGVRCGVSPIFVEHLLKQSKFHDVAISKAEMSTTEFEMTITDLLHVS
jgi:hypothetical protein